MCVVLDKRSSFNAHEGGIEFSYIAVPGVTFRRSRKYPATTGIFPTFLAGDVFALAARPANVKKDLVIGASFFEIYSGKVYDLLNKKVRLRILEDKRKEVQIVGLAGERVQGVDDVLRLAHGA